MYHFISLLTYIFDMTIIIAYMNGILQKRKQTVSNPVFFACFFGMELFIYVNQTLCEPLPTNISLVVTSSVSLFTTFALSFLYETTLSNRIFVSVSFQILVLLGEAFFTLLVKAVNPSILDTPMEQLSVLMNFGSKFTLFLLSLSIVAFWNRRIRYRNSKYNILLFATPVTSLLIMLSTSLKENLAANNSFFLLLLHTSLAVLNIVNYLLLEDCFNMQNIRYEYKNMQRQIHFQQEKYYQLGIAYKKNRGIVHDVKKHYFTMSEFIKNRQYDKLDAYLHSALEDIETCYAGVSSGNLVIDAFLNNFKSLAQAHQFLFAEKIALQPDKIPLADYDLCTIIGNLLDNAFEAVCEVLNPNRYVHMTIYIAGSKTFIIHTKNSCVPKTQQPSSYVLSLERGYGLSNIRQIVETHMGIMRYTQTDDAFEVIITIPITSNS